MSYADEDVSYMTRQQLHREVAQAAQLLDDRSPGWFHLVADPHQSSPVRCVLAQVYGNFSNAVRYLDLGSQPAAPWFTSLTNGLWEAEVRSRQQAAHRPDLLSRFLLRRRIRRAL